MGPSSFTLTWIPSGRRISFLNILGGIIRPLLYILLNALKTVPASLFLRGSPSTGDMQALLILENTRSPYFQAFCRYRLAGYYLPSILIPWDARIFFPSWAGDINLH